MAEIIHKFYIAIPWIVYIGAGIGLYVLVGTLSSGPGEVQTLLAYVIMMLVYAFPPMLPYYIKIVPDLYAILDIRLAAAAIIILIAWAGNDGEWLWGLVLSIVPIVASWFILSLV